MNTHSEDISYYALLHCGEAGQAEVGGLCRRVESDQDLRLERFELPSGRWVQDEEALAPYFYGPEGGLVEISPEEARELGAVLSEGTLPKDF